MTRYRVEPGEIESNPGSVDYLTKHHGITLTLIEPEPRYYVERFQSMWTLVRDREAPQVNLVMFHRTHPYPVTAATAEADRLNALDAAEEAETEDLPSVDADAARFYVDEVPGSGITIYDREEEAINGRPFRATGWITATHPGAAEAAEAACAALNRVEAES